MLWLHPHVWRKEYLAFCYFGKILYLPYLKTLQARKQVIFSIMPSFCTVVVKNKGRPHTKERLRLHPVTLVQLHLQSRHEQCNVLHLKFFRTTWLSFGFLKRNLFFVCPDSHGGVHEHPLEVHEHPLELLCWGEVGIHLLCKVHTAGNKVERLEHPPAPLYQLKTVTWDLVFWWKLLNSAQ